MKLKSYTLNLVEDGSDSSIMFECKAENAEHAIEQARNAYPSANIEEESVRLFTLVIEVFTTDDDADGPRFAELVTTDQWLAKADRLVAVVKTHQLNSADVHGGEVVWHDEDSYRINMVELVVSEYGLWYEGYPKYGNYHFETRAIDPTAFGNIVEYLAGRASELPPGFEMHNGIIFRKEDDDEIVQDYFDYVGEAA